MARYYLLTNARAQSERLKALSSKTYDVFTTVYGAEAFWMGDSKEVKKLYSALKEVRQTLNRASQNLNALSNKVVAVAQDIYSKELAEEMERKANGN